MRAALMKLAAEKKLSARTGTPGERAAELFYSWSPVASIKVRPNLQYVHDPGGVDGRRDALVAGIYSSVKF